MAAYKENSMAVDTRTSDSDFIPPATEPGCSAGNTNGTRTGQTIHQDRTVPGPVP
jgi:hypothetical protein